MEPTIKIKIPKTPHDLYLKYEKYENKDEEDKEVKIVKYMDELYTKKFVDDYFTL
jgi:hypothetical protein